MATDGNSRTNLVLRVTTNIDPAVWDESRYEPFIDELCGYHWYQKEAIRTVMRYLAGGKYESLRELAKENFDTNEGLQRRYGSLPGMDRHLQLPDQLACSVDMAIGTGKSYILYGLAAILLAEGIIDRVLVLAAPIRSKPACWQSSEFWPGAPICATCCRKSSRFERRK